MTRPIISVQNLSKQYRITGHEAAYGSLRESLVGAIREPLNRIRKRRKAEEDSIWALKDVEFNVMPGEILGVIGRNGAGKSTLLKLLSRITEPTTGRIALYGRVGSLLEVGTGFHHELTGRENIYLSGSILGMKRTEIQRLFDEIVDYAEVAKFIDTPVKRYSTGMYLRLAFAVAAHLEPEILVIDEVLAVGDASFQKKCLTKIGDVAHQGRTVLFVSHNMNAIEQLCSRALLLDKGGVKRFDADVRDVIKEYLFADDELEPSEWAAATEQEFANPWFRPLRFFIADENGRRAPMPLTNDAEMWIHIEGEVKSLNPALTVGYAIYSEEGHLLYWSYHTDQSPDSWPRLSEGLCVLRSKIPKHFLNEGLYRIELIGGLHFKQWLFQPSVSAPHLFLSIQGGLSDSPMWMTKRPGSLAPIMEWYVDEHL